MKNAILWLCFLAPALSFAGDRPDAWIDLPLVDSPFNFTHNSPNAFSMRQSVELSTSTYEVAHRLIMGDPDKRAKWFQWVGLIGFDVFMEFVPPGAGWMHEEWHRSVMTRHGIGSFNDMNTIPIGRALIAVSHVDDADLVALKRDHPADQVRLSAAGMESQVFQNQLIGENHFFHGARSKDFGILWANAFSVTGYLTTCAGPGADTSTDEQNADDGTDVSKRDFTGLDCTAWVYDLFRPDEPYTKRGIHPSGLGINRYIHFSDLNEKEQKFLKWQATLSFFNFLDPQMYRVRDFHAEIDGEDLRWTVSFRHYLTSFGGTVDTNLFLAFREEQYLVTWHSGMTDTRYLPGVTLKWVETALPWSSFFLTSSATLWQQPRDQRVEESSDDTVVDASVELSYRQDRNWSYYAGIEAKTAGWIAGNVYTDANTSAWLGLRASMF